MPASNLTPAQRKAEAERQRMDANRPKPRRRGSQSIGGLNTRSQTGDFNHTAPAAASSPRPAAVTSSSGNIHTYKEHGSDLHVGRYKTLAEHRAAVEKAKGGGSGSGSGNSTPPSSTPTNTAPNGKEYYGPGGGPNSNPARQYNTPDERSKYVAPNGKPYHGPAFGDQVASKKPAETKTQEKKPDSKPQRRVSAGDQRYMTELERRRKGISNVIG